MGMAIILVMMLHFQSIGIYSEKFRILEAIFKHGNVGVEMFLFLSGIGLYFSYSKNNNLRQFYKKRFMRIMIPYILICAPYYIWIDIFRKEGSFIEDITQISFYKDGQQDAWYIAAIFLFYLLFPAFYKLIFRNNGKNALFTTIALVSVLLGGGVLS